MSDSQGPPDLSAFMPQGDEAVGQPTDTGEGSGEADYSISSDFLKNVPDSDRAVVSRYIKDWDAGVTKRFRKFMVNTSPTSN